MSNLSSLQTSCATEPRDAMFGSEVANQHSIEQSVSSGVSHRPVSSPVDLTLGVPAAVG